MEEKFDLEDLYEESCKLREEGYFYEGMFNVFEDAGDPGLKKEMYKQLYKKASCLYSNFDYFDVEAPIDVYEFWDINVSDDVKDFAWIGVMFAKAISKNNTIAEMIINCDDDATLATALLETEEKTIIAILERLD